MMRTFCDKCQKEITTRVIEIRIEKVLNNQICVDCLEDFNKWFGHTITLKKLEDKR